ncbi:MAG: hypothetical protein ACRDP1_10975 [Nocardioidaceae bacterium]
MAEVASFPSRGEVFFDARGQGRALRMSWHHDDGVVVLSLWRDGLCAGSFRLRAEEVSEFVDNLVSGLGEGYAQTQQSHDVG